VITWENTYKELEESGVDIAVLPIGALEQHSIHLPLGQDWMSVQEMARRIAEQLDAYLLPALPFGNSQEHQDFKGTVWLQPATLAQVVKDIVACLRHHGFRKVVLVNGHGGNWILKPTVREIDLARTGIMVIWVGPERLAPGAVTVTELHSGRSETSRALALFPHLVKDERIDFVPDVGREFLDYVGVKGVCQDGVWGEATKATAEEGRQAIEAGVEAAVNYIKDTFARLEEAERRLGLR
jgi:creatinine amidohydrolase